MPRINMGLSYLYDFWWYNINHQESSRRGANKRKYDVLDNSKQSNNHAHKHVGVICGWTLQTLNRICSKYFRDNMNISSSFFFTFVFYISYRCVLCGPSLTKATVLSKKVPSLDSSKTFTIKYTQRNKNKMSLWQLF